MRTAVLSFYLFFVANAVVAALPTLPTLPPTRELPPVTLPNDEGYHDFPIEWWYYTGHLESDDKVPRKFAFEIVVFRGEAFGISGYVAQFALIDLDKKTHHGFQRINPLAAQLPGAPTNKGFKFTFTNNSWIIEGANGRDHVKAKTVTHEIDLNLVATKPAAIYGDCGIVDYGTAGKLAYYSRTRMQSEGIIKIPGMFPWASKTYRVTGVTWMDHQWGGDTGNPSKFGWDWFSSHLSSGDDLMMFRIRNRKDGTVIQNSGFIVDKDGVVKTMLSNDISIAPMGTDRHNNKYPLKWSLKATGAYPLDLVTTASFADQLFKIPGQVTPIYWEGANITTGTFLGAPVTGRGFTELVGYE